ncbi:MAG: hypothetical protein HYS21_10650 [Deltaproteobacteria bacterium]|nr:hypothetical protein [Deltaproteobacteria bacterium]
MKYIAPQVPAQARLKAAKGEFEETEFAPEDKVTAFFVLSYDKDSEVAEAAKKSLAECSIELHLSALEGRLDPLVIKKIIELHREDDAILIMAALNDGTDDATLKWLAESGPEEVITVIADDIARLKKKPFLIDALKKNPLASKLLINEVEGLMAKPIAPAPHTEQAPTPKALVDEAAADDHNIYQAVKGMSTGQKIKLALSGNKSAREYLIKDSNKIIALSVLKNPRITEDEVQRLISSKGTPEDLLRHVARNKEWLKNYSVKLGMVANAKTPLSISIKLLDHLYEKDLDKIGKSKNIPSVLASAARRKVEAKAKK